jgi:hypothetical protein
MEHVMERVDYEMILTSVYRRHQEQVNKHIFDALQQLCARRARARARGAAALAAERSRPLFTSNLWSFIYRSVLPDAAHKASLLWFCSTKSSDVLIEGIPVPYDASSQDGKTELNGTFRLFRLPHHASAGFRRYKIRWRADLTEL